MAEKKEQVKPLTQSVHRFDIYEPEPEPFFETLPRSHSKYIKLCGCLVAILLILVTILLILTFTVFHVKEPILSMNDMKIDGLDILGTNNTGVTNPGLNLTFVAGLSIKNPNVAAFKFDNTTTYVYYDGFLVGEVMTPRGKATSRRTIRVDVSIDVKMDKISEVERFRSDLVARVLPLSTYTRVIGRVKITEYIKRSHVVVTMNCTMDVNLSSNSIQHRNCRRRVSL